MKQRLSKGLAGLFTPEELQQIAYGWDHSTLYGDKLRRSHPLRYWATLVLLMLLLFTPLTLFCLWGETTFNAPPSRLINALAAIPAILGVIGALILGVAPANELMRLLRGYLGWKVTVLCLILGSSVTAACMALLQWLHQL